MRKYFTAEAGLELSSGFIWGMVGFSTLSFIMSLGGIYAALESRKISAEEPWNKIDVNMINYKNQKKLVVYENQ